MLTPNFLCLHNFRGASTSSVITCRSLGHKVSQGIKKENFPRPPPRVPRRPEAEAAGRWDSSLIGSSPPLSRRATRCVASCACNNKHVTRHCGGLGAVHHKGPRDKDVGGASNRPRQIDFPPPVPQEGR